MLACMIDYGRIAISPLKVLYVHFIQCFLLEESALHLVMKNTLQPVPIYIKQIENTLMTTTKV